MWAHLLPGLCAGSSARLPSCLCLPSAGNRQRGQETISSERVPMPGQLPAAETGTGLPAGLSGGMGMIIGCFERLRTSATRVSLSPSQRMENELCLMVPQNVRTKGSRHIFSVTVRVLLDVSVSRNPVPAALSTYAGGAASTPHRRNRVQPARTHRRKRRATSQCILTPSGGSPGNGRAAISTICW